MLLGAVISIALSLITTCAIAAGFAWDVLAGTRIRAPELRVPALNNLVRK